jgi:hypothetical protein
MSAKFLVMGFATNQGERSLRVFVKSLRRVYDEATCDIVIITNRFENNLSNLSSSGVHFASTPNNYSVKTGRVAKAINRTVLNAMRAMSRVRFFERVAPEIGETYPVLLETWHHPHFARWFAYRRFLSLNRGYSQVFLADVKDVVFQDAFFLANAPKAAWLFDQDEKYGSSRWDTPWYRDAFGETELQRVLGKSSVCIGTILGSHTNVLSLVEELCAFFSRSPFGRIEQAVFNYMLLNGLIKTPYEIIPNVSGPVATLSNDSVHRRTRTAGGAIFRANDDSLIPVVHMYDRFKDTREAYLNFGSAVV